MGAKESPQAPCWPERPNVRPKGQAKGRGGGPWKRPLDGEVVVMAIEDSSQGIRSPGVGILLESCVDVVVGTWIHTSLPLQCGGPHERKVRPRRFCGFEVLHGQEEGRRIEAGHQ